MLSNSVASPPDITLTEFFDVIRRTADLTAPGWTRTSVQVYHGPDCPPTAIQVFPSAATPPEPPPSEPLLLVPQPPAS
jgi:hypothetical protein